MWEGSSDGGCSVTFVVVIVVNNPPSFWIDAANIAVV
jgi:hypothetical protein